MQKKVPPNNACSGLAGTQAARGQVLNPPTANASRWAASINNSIVILTTTLETNKHTYNSGV